MWKNRQEKIFFMFIFIITYSFMFFTMYYADLTLTSRFSMTFIDSLFDGKYASFYNNCIHLNIAPEGAVYDLGIYIVFAIWGIPVWILNKTIDIDVLSVGSQLWFKTCIIVFAIWLVKITVDFAKELKLVSEDEKDAEDLAFSVILSPLLIFPILVAAQYDVLPLCFLMYGFLMFIRDKRLLGLLFMGISLTMKPITIIGIIGFILLYEKRISKICILVLECIIPVFVCKLIYALNITNNASNNKFFGELLPRLFSVSIKTDKGNISLFVMLIIIIYFWIFLCQSDSDNLILSQFAIWGVFIGFANIYPYWIVYIVPFVSVLPLIKNHSFIKMSKLMLFIFEWMTILLMVIDYPWVYGGTLTYGYLVLKPLFSGINVSSISTLYETMRRFGIDVFRPAINAIVVMGMVLALMIKCVHIPDDSETIDNGLYISNWIKIIPYIAFVLICLWKILRIYV